MEFKELEYERLVEEREIRRKIAKLDADLAGLKKKYKKDRGELVKQLQALEKELDSGALQPKLFDGKYLEKQERIEVSEQDTDDREQQTADDGKDKPVKKKRIKQGDMMKVERTLRAVAEFTCDGIDDDDVIGCCQCERQCSKRDARYGMAIKCLNDLACSANCPRLMEDVVEDVPDSKEKPIKKANTCVKWPHRSCGGGCKDKTCCNCDDDCKQGCAKPGIFPCRVHEEGYPKPGKDAPETCDSTPPKSFIESTLKEEDRPLPDSGLDVTIRNKEHQKNPDLNKTLFRGYYNLSFSNTKKEIKFKPYVGGGWGKPEKFTNEQQYYARMEELRANPKYIES